MNTLSKDKLTEVNDLIRGKRDDPRAKFDELDNFGIGIPTTDVSVGDYILWIEALFVGKYPNAERLGYNYFHGEVEKIGSGRNAFVSIKRPDETTLKKSRRTIFRHKCIIIDQGA